MFGEFFSCCCLTLQPQLACSILVTCGLPYTGALYVDFLSIPLSLRTSYINGPIFGSPSSAILGVPFRRMHAREAHDEVTRLSVIPSGQK